MPAQGFVPAVFHHAHVGEPIGVWGEGAAVGLLELGLALGIKELKRGQAQNRIKLCNPLASRERKKDTNKQRHHTHKFTSVLT